MLKTTTYQLRFYARLTILLGVACCLTIPLRAQIPPPTCNFSGGPYPVFTANLNTDNAPLMTSVPVLGDLGDDVTVASAASVEICFWGDMGGGGETFDLIIAGQTFSTGGFGTDPTMGNPTCRTFMVTAMNVDGDLIDGDLDIVYDNFGSGWNSGSNDFNARVDAVSFTYTVDVTINQPSDRCQDAADITFVGQPMEGSISGDNGVFSIFPSSGGFNAGTGALDVSATDPGTYSVVYEYTFNGCIYQATTEIEIFPTPRANLRPTTVNCRVAGQTINLEVMFDGSNTPGGTWSLTEGSAPINGSQLTVPAEGGCFLVRYALDNPNDCNNAPYLDEARLLVTAQPQPELSITPITSGATTQIACSPGGSIDIEVTNTGGTGGATTLSVDGTGVPLGTVSLAAPASAGSIVYDLCLTETGAAPPACPGITPPAPCSATVCRTYTVYNDGVDCGENAPFASTCDPDPDDVDTCPVSDNPNLTLSCSFFELAGPQFIEADIDLIDGVITCMDTEVCFTYSGSLPGELGNAAAGGPTLAELNGATRVICNIITFEICTPRIPVVGRYCFDPIPLGSFEDACDQTLGQIIASALSAAVGGDGGGGIVVADTDGDGSFDYIVDEYDFPTSNQEACVPNNIETATGTITIRNVTAFPFAPSGYCGEVTGESIDLLELLPIGAIPLVGVIIEDLLAAASCNVELAFSDSDTQEVPVLNRIPPVFANCNTDGYLFSEDGICDTEVNWSIPVVYDGCEGDVLTYRGRTAGTDATRFVGTPEPVIVPTESGVYQTAGPIPGSDLDPGTYSVTYTAYSCAGVESTCTFDVVVAPGDPVLACPFATQIKTDVDQCSAVVTGLAPLQGMSCATVINYSVAFADGTTAASSTPYTTDNRGTHNDVSGLVYPLGVSTVTYTMQVDLNGDGDADDDGETQTCDFTVTVVDGQRPDALCTDIDVRLDNTGNVTVFAADPLNGQAFVDGGSTDNCDTDLTIEIAKPGGAFAPSISFDCTENGYGLVTLRATDHAGNSSTCLAQVQVIDFFDGISFDFDIPELCLEANNPEQLDFSNYLVITLPDGTVLNAEDVAANAYLGDAVGGFGITAFAPDVASTSIDPGTIDTAGIYTPGTGSGFVTVSYVMVLPGVQNVPQNANVALSGCLEIVHTTFELRQPLDMASPECECIQQNDRVVNLGEISGGLEPYTLQYGGVRLDVDSDGVADDFDGEYTFDTGNGHDISDFTQDLGNLLVDYTQPTWSFTVVDARGCELFRSGSCDNDDETGTPEIDCTALGAVTLYTRDEPACEVQDTWVHTLPTDNCDVILYTYTIENPDGTIAGPFDLTALLNPDITNPLPDQFIGEYDFQHHSPTENVSTVTYYAEDAVGNFTQCSFTVTVIDDDSPNFINCPEPAVIVDAPPTWCAAFANYSLPLATDNCGGVTVTQIDDTGLTSGSLFPVGLTINTFEAVDETGNTTTCDVKIIVNDYHTPPTIDCPADVSTTNDFGDCGAVVDDIAPSGITDNCPENLTVIYRIDNAEGNEVANGLDDASGTFFELGTSTVRYAVQDMPLLLITEVTHELSHPVDGSPVTTSSCFDGVQNGDEADVDCGGGVCASCNCTTNEVSVEILLDGNPEQTTWTITEPNDGAVLAAGGPYPVAAAGTVVTDFVCLPDGSYDFVIRDTGLDGICCASGDGSYTVTTRGEVIASGGTFGVREVTNFFLDGTPAAASLIGSAGTRDAFEITNFGSAALDVSCLMIERVFADGSETYAVPNGAVLEPGGVLSIYFGDGHDDLANNVFYVPGTTDLPTDEPTAYILSLSRSVLDVAVLNGFDLSGILVPPAYELGGFTAADYWSGTVGPVYGGGIVRTTVWDTDTAADFVPGEACFPVTIGQLNPGLPQPTPNGAQTALQAQPTVRVECDFTVTVTDNEAAVCGLYGDYVTYAGPTATIAYGECVELTIAIDEQFNVADLNLALTGLAGDFSDLTFTLISAEGTSIELLEGECAGATAFDFLLDGDPELADPFTTNCANLNGGAALVPVGNIEAFNGEQAQGTWTLQIGHDGRATQLPSELTAWSLEISAREPYDQTDVTLENDLDLCGAEFTYLHPILFDNCPGGTVRQTITFEDGTVELDQPLPIFPENTAFTYFFQVGETTVLYTLTDAAGNVSTCGFVVTVLDTQFPEITCPDDLVIQLDPGECETDMYPTTPVFEYDNCPEYVLSSFPPGTPVPIGDTVITLIITDASGNETTCTYNLTVLEFETAQELACINEQNVSLGADCEATITPDMVLSGNLYRCYDNYVVTLLTGPPTDGGEVIPTSPVITTEYVGETIVAEVCDPETGECCWGYINVEYKLIPEFICPADVTVNCTDETGPELLGFPEVTSCVPGGAIITFDDVVQDNDDCGDPRLVITRTWTVADGVGNADQCVQTITVAAFDLGQIIFPENYNGTDNPPLDCADVLADPTLTEPENLGFPTIDGQPLFASNLCSAAMNYTDETFYSCENSFTIFRQWRVINECLPNPLATALTFTQIIRVEDLDGPDLVCPDDEVISVSPFACTATYEVPPLVAIDACSEVIYQVEVNGDTLPYNPDNTYLLSDLPIGVHTIAYLAVDECGETSSCDYLLTVEDQIEPTAVCDDELNVSLGGGDILNGLSGEARILASDVDEGSNDNCSAVTLAVRRNFWADGDCSDNAEAWSPWGDFVDFYCCDVGREVTIELRVTDAVGNENICWLVTTPEDKLDPFCYAPEDVALDCNDLPLTFPGNIEDAYDDDFAGTSLMMDALFGGASGTDNCAVDTIVERSPNVQLNECGWGTITRRFEAWQVRPEGDVNGNGAIDIGEVDRSTNACRQIITINEVHDFTIDFPEDVAADCADPDVPTIITTAAGCDVLSVNIGEPQFFAASGDECYKLGITYDVINWCVWDGEYEGLVLPRITEDDGEALPVDRVVEGNERPVVSVVSSLGPVDNNCDDLADAGGDGVQYALLIDRRHDDRDGDSSIPDTVYDNIPGNGISCIPADQFGRRNYGRFIYTQFVKVYDSTAPVVTVGDFGGPTANCPNLLPGQFGDDDGDCAETVSIPFTVTDACELFDGAGNLVIELVSAELDAFAVDANGDGDIKADEFVAEAGPAGDVLDNVIDNGDGTYLITGTYPIITTAMGDNVYHAIRVLLRDGCGNLTSQIFVFDLIDCKAPAPICVNGLTVTLMPQEPGTDADGDGDEDFCAMTIWAADFAGSAIDDCTAQGPETGPDGLPRVTAYAIYRAADVEADPDFTPHPTATGLILTQDDAATTVVYIYAFDQEGNYDYCETYVLVQQHENCDPDGDGTVQGVIATENAETIEGVEVSLSGDLSGVVTTGIEGTYSLNYQPGGDYSITPYLNVAPLNGVSTFDLVLMSKHILGVQLLEGPYKLIAADVNRSESITTLDLIRLRKLILNIDTEFVGNTSWRFISADYDFPVVTDPWHEEFPEVYSFNNAPPTLNADFIGVKIGDVNGSAQANALAGDERTLNGEYKLTVENAELFTGNVYTIAVRGTDLEAVEGFQGTLRLDGAELVDLEHGLMNAEHFGLRYMDAGYVTFSWNTPGRDAIHRVSSQDVVLFSLVIRPTVDAELSEVLSVSSRYTVAEAYGNGMVASNGQTPSVLLTSDTSPEGGLMSLGLAFTQDGTAADGFELYQNTPNPFAKETVIGFYLPDTGVNDELLSVRLTITDVNGRLLTRIEGSYPAGYHVVSLLKERIGGATGVLNYTLTAESRQTQRAFSATRGMIVVE